MIYLDRIPMAKEWLVLAWSVNSELPVPEMSCKRYRRELREFLGFRAWPQDITRHTAASYLYAKLEDAAQVACFIGNSPDTLARHYRAIVTREQAEEWFKLTVTNVGKRATDAYRCVLDVALGPTLPEERLRRRAEEARARRAKPEVKERTRLYKRGYRKRNRARLNADNREYWRRRAAKKGLVSCWQLAM
jgi:hypothetical protein